MRKHLADIVKALENFADKNRLDRAKINYPTQMRTIGVYVPNVRIVMKELKTQIKGYSSAERLNLYKELCDSGIIECQQLGFLLFEKDLEVLNSLQESDVDDLGRFMDNWVSVDHYAGLIVGYAWRKGIIRIDKIKGYLQSDDFWIRRIAVVATVALNQKARGANGDTRQTLEICEDVVKDHEKMVVMALSWALRELSKIDPVSVSKFLEKHQEHLHKKVLKEVGHKLEFGTKN